MGYIRHHVIVVTSWSEESILRAYTTALAMFDGVAAVTPVTEPAVNAERSFMVAPDGSKEGWGASDRGDAARATFIDWLQSARYDDGSSNLNWVEVEFGGDDRDMLTTRWAEGRVRTYEDAAGNLRAEAERTED